MSRYEGKRHFASFIKLYLLFLPFFIILCGIAALTDETLMPIDFLYLAIAVLLIGVLPSLLIMRLSPVYVSGKGLRVRPQTFKSVLVEWDRMVSVQPRRFLHFRYMNISVNGIPEPLQLGIDMQDMKGFIRDVSERAPMDNPLRAYLERGELVSAAGREMPKTGGEDGAAPVQAQMPMPQAPVESIEEKIKADLRLEGQLKNGANWFYWIAGLSLVNTVSLLIGWDWSFVAGLAVTQGIDALALAVSEYFTGGVVTVIRAAAVAIDLLIAGIFVIFGIFANRKHRWSFITGMSLYAVDCVLCLLFQSYLSAAVHAVAFFGILAGYKAIKKLSGRKA